MKYMLDTNICIFIQKGNHSVLRNLNFKRKHGIAISAIALAELEAGVEASIHIEKNKRALLNFLTIAEILPFDEAAAAEYGRIYADLRKKGTLISPMDMLIAAHAKVAGLAIVTDNVREFERVDGLEIENWA